MQVIPELISCPILGTFSRFKTSLGMNVIPSTIRHVPVMKYEVLEQLNLQNGQVFLDMTFGMGGHSQFILENVPKLNCFFLDRDPYCFQFMEQLKNQYSDSCDSITPLTGKFSDIPQLLSSLGPGSVDAILMDLGVSSVQLDDADRGFSIKHDAFLDMRMNPNENNIPTGADVLKSLSAPELAQIFHIYGEEKFSRRIANAIVDFRTERGDIRTSGQLASIVESIVPNSVQRCKHGESRTFVHVATRIFQALRIFVNDELNELCAGLHIAEQLLKPGGRLVVLSFHSLEDRLVKWTLHRPVDNLSTGCSDYLVQKSQGDSIADRKRSQLIRQLHIDDNREVNSRTQIWLPIVGPLLPSDEEINFNPRSRSAKLRAGQKI